MELLLMTTFDLMFEDSLSRTLYIFLMPSVKVTGTTDKWCVEQPAGWRQLCCWNWGGVMTTEDFRNNSTKSENRGLSYIRKLHKYYVERYK